jgi:hypothetical protein
MDTRVNPTFVVVRDICVDEISGGAGISYNWGWEQGGGMMGGMQSKMFRATILHKLVVE